VQLQDCPPLRSQDVQEVGTGLQSQTLSHHTLLALDGVSLGKTHF